MKNQTKNIYLTEHQKIIVFMFRNKNKFISAKDLANLSGNLFVGYECSARFSEIRNDILNDYIIQEKRGRFIYAKVDWERMKTKNESLYLSAQRLYLSAK